MQEKFMKIISGILVMIILLSQSGVTISYAVNEILTEEQLENQDTGNDKNIEFDIFYEDNKHNKKISIDEDNQTITAKINLKNIGYTEDGVIDFSDCNFKIIDNEKQEIINQIKDDKVILNRLIGGEEYVITLGIEPNIKDDVSNDFFNKDNNIKFTGTFVNENEKSIKIEKSIVLHTEWKIENIETSLNQTITKYVPFSLENYSGILLQTKVETGVKENKVPIKKENIEILVPKISDILPEKVNISIANSSFGKTELLEDEWEYDEKAGIIKINLVNSNNGNVSWVKGSSDIFDITLIYSKEALINVYETGTNIKLKTAVNYEFYGTDNKDDKLYENEYYVKEQIGNIIDIKSKINKEKISKGYIYTNKVASEENKKETKYNQEYEVNISDESLIDEIILNQENDIFRNENSLYAEGNFKNKTFEIDRQEFINIFGEQGTITLTIGENQVYINSKTEVDENNKIKINLEKYEGNLKIVTSKPEKTGTLTINIEKEISKEQKYSLEEIKTFKELQTSTQVIAKYKNNEIPVSIEESKVQLEEPTSKVSATINKESLSTILANENVEIKVTMETDSVDDILYKNPKMLVAFPSYVNKIEVTNCKSLYSDEIKIISTELTESQGRKVFVINFEGTQTLYNDETTKGINIVLNANIETDRLTPSIKDNIEIVCTNENEDTHKNILLPVKFIAPVGLVSVNEIYNYESGKKLTLINENNTNKEEKAIITTYANSKKATVKGTIINNYNNTLSNMKILGKIPNTEVAENTFDLELQSEIICNSNAKIYYSANSNATSDIENEANGWVEGKVNYKNVKSFLIVLNDEIETGSKIEFGYDISIPSNLSFNNESKLKYDITYNKKDTSATTIENKQSGIINITTGAGPNLEIKVNTEEAINGELKQGQYVKFRADVTNIGTDATGVKLAIDETYGKVKKYNDGFDFEDEENVKEIGELKAGETKSISYILQINEDAEITDNAEFTVGGVADKITAVITGSQKIKIAKGKILLKNIIIASKSQTGTAEFIKGENGSCGLYLKNISNEDLENLVVTYKVGNQINITEAGEVSTFYSPIADANESNISSDKHTLTYVIDKIGANETKVIRINILSNSVGEDVTFKAGITLEDNWNMNANTQTVNINEYKVEIKSLQIDSKNQERKPGEEVKYLYSVKNTGDLIISIGKISAAIPEGATFKNAVIASKINDTNIYNETIESVNENIFEYDKTFLEVGEELIINITAQVNGLSQEEKELSMKLKFTAMGIEKESDPEIYYAIEDNNKTYKISGKIWKDANKNSKKDDNEEGVEGVDVVLFDRQTMKIAEKENGEIISTKTGSNGTYEFSGIKNGKYLVGYLYNDEDYELSQYQKDDILDSQNSDATSKNAKYNGEDKVIALTDVIEISDASKRNIDLGLIEKEKFNLNLVKEISKITINENGKVKETNYEENSKLAKVKVSDDENNSKTVIAQYNILIKNEGNVAGYANKVVSYLSDDMKFSSELNPDWYLGEDGNVYSTALADTKIEAGETKKLQLVLTKNIKSEDMSEEDRNKEIINSKSEISEEYNEKGIESKQEYNAKARNATASIEVVKKNQTLTTVIIVLVVMAIVITSGSVIYINRDKIKNKSYNKMYLKNNLKKIKDIINNFKK